MTTVLATGAVPRPAFADDNGAWHTAAKLFVGAGGSYFTSGSAMQALGNPKFSTTTSLFVRPKVQGPMAITGGIQYLGAGDHWQPLAGGNSLRLIGPAFRVQQIPRMNRLAPFVTGGLFYGGLQSYNEGFRAYGWAPSMAVGAEYRFARYVSLVAAYRAT